jgi:HTH-type transcriptional regulator/antitoxin MqsA
VLEVPFRGNPVEVSGVVHGKCAGCGEVFLGVDEMEQLQKVAATKVRASQGLLQPNEIKALRASLGLSQVALENLLGVGAKTVVRWEKGTVFQSATADRLMGLLREMPELKAVLASEEFCGATRVSSLRAHAKHYEQPWRRTVAPALTLVRGGRSAAAA